MKMMEQKKLFKIIAIQHVTNQDIVDVLFFVDEKHAEHYLNTVKNTKTIETVCSWCSVDEAREYLN